MERATAQHDTSLNYTVINTCTKMCHSNECFSVSRTAVECLTQIKMCLIDDISYENNVL